MLEKKLVTLPKGGTLELEIWPGFMDKVRQHFLLSSDQEPTDEQLRMFVYGAFKGAIDKAEKEGVVDG